MSLPITNVSLGISDTFKDIFSMDYSDSVTTVTTFLEPRNGPAENKRSEILPKLDKTAELCKSIIAIDPDLQGAIASCEPHQIIIHPLPVNFVTLKAWVKESRAPVCSGREKESMICWHQAFLNIERILTECREIDDGMTDALVTVWENIV